MFRLTCIFNWIRGAMVARLTPDQKVACSIHVGFNFRFSFFFSSAWSAQYPRLRSQPLTMNPFHFSLQCPNPSPFPFSRLKPQLAITRASSSAPVSTRPRRRTAHKTSDASEAAELVRVLLRKSADGEEPLVSTLSKFVTVIRTEHSFSSSRS